MFAITLCSVVFIEARLARPYLPLPVDPRAILIAGTALLAPVVAATALAALIEGRGMLSYGLAARNWRPMFARGAAAGIATLVVVVSVLATSGNFSIGGWTSLGTDEIALGAAWWAFFALLAVAEELLFRGYMLATVTRVMGFPRAAILTGIAFGVVHSMTPRATAVVLLTLTIAGIALAWIVRLTGSIWWGAGFLTAWNWGQNVVYACAPLRQLTNAAIRSFPLGDPTMSGGLYGAEASIVVLPIACVALALAIVLVARREKRAPGETPRTLTLPAAERSGY
ncbi:MAG TPA: type II CAAX endopeptidase family protein [Candidatus Elarobacter sp.]|nr:type II CAAX endopeptidase family protein [Candidatus Elarobacter sp.]